MAEGIHVSILEGEVWIIGNECGMVRMKERMGGREIGGI